ncbi:MAG: hypothetical protein LLG08_08905 [Actinomycetia bacterium]|nr:hypothetical protein [Actinomycetes bacterium]
MSDARSNPPAPTGYGPLLTIALGLFLVVTGPLLALLTLLISPVGEQTAASPGFDLLSTVHGAGLLAGLAGGVLLLVGLGWGLTAAIRRSRATRSAA